MTAQMFDLTIIVPNYNTIDLLHDCIASIYEHTNWISFEIICIDDSSSEGSAEMVAKSFPDVILRRGDSPPYPDWTFDRGISEFVAWVKNQRFQSDKYEESISEMACRGIYK
jgi:glycosyltransferase involved in cell wall biosynthesis